MYFAHGPLSFVLNEKIQEKDISKLTKGEHIAIALLSVFFGILPDFDLFILSIVDIPTFQHHQVFTHSVLFWLILWGVLRLGIYIVKRIANTGTEKALNTTFLNILHRSFLIGVMSHLFADILFSHAYIFLPLDIEITIFGDVLGKGYFSSNIFTVSMAVELFILILFALYMYKEFVKRNKIFEYTVYAFMAFSVSIVLLSTYISVNTYSNARYTENGKIQYDADYDSLIDYQDSDTNNDGIDNIQSVDKDMLADDAQRIIEGEYFTGNTGIVYRYGGLTSYRLISQSFFEQNLAIEPVLNTFARNEYNIRGYAIENRYWDTLYAYFKQNSMLKDFDVNVERGNIFFVLDSEEDVENQGIVLGNSSVGIVLKGDVRTRTHTLQEVYDEYKENIFKVQKDR
jgi:hypothetical protein